MAEVMVFGHSYIRRLKEFCLAEGKSNMGFRTDEVEVEMVGFGGMKFPKTWDGVSIARQYEPDVMIVQVGGNDLGSPNSSPQALVTEIIEFGSLLVSSGVKTVRICQLLPRLRCRAGYNDDVETTNNMLEEQLNKSGMTPGVRFWYHNKGLNSRNPLLYLPDGVHLNPKGYRRYFASVRGAVINGLKDL